MSNAELLKELRRLAAHSDCAKIRFGAVALSPASVVIGRGWNHNPRPSNGWSCAEHCAGGIRKDVRSGTCVERCYAVHAEQHALLNAQGRVFEVAVAGLLPDGTLFNNSGGFYCTVCARLLAVAGVQFVSVWALGERKRLTMTQAWADSYRIATE